MKLKTGALTLFASVFLLAVTVVKKIRLQAKQLKQPAKKLLQLKQALKRYLVQKIRQVTTRMTMQMVAMRVQAQVKPTKLLQENSFLKMKRGKLL